MTERAEETEVSVIEKSSPPSESLRDTTLAAETMVFNADELVDEHVTGWAWNWEYAVAPMLVGTAMAWQLCGLQAVFSAHIDFLPTTSVMVCVLALLMAAIGAGLPERAMSLVQRLLRYLPDDWGEGAGIRGRLNPFWLLGLTRQSDPELPWISLALLGAAGGLLSLVSLMLAGVMFAVHRGLLASFFWTHLTMAGMEWAITGIILMAPSMACGLTMVMLASVAGVHHRIPRQGGQRVLTGMLAGIGLGWMLHGPFMAWGMSAEREVMISSLPLFVIAIIGARASQRAESNKPPTDVAASTGPELAAGSEMLTGLASMVWAIGVAAAWTGWLVCHGDFRAGHRPAPGGVGVLLAGVSFAGLVAAQMGAHLGPRLTGYGLAVWTCGIGAGAAASLAVWWPDSTVSWILQVVLLVAPTGYGVHQVAGYWLARASNGTLGFAHLSITLLTGTAIGLAASRWWGLSNLGAMGTLAAGSLSLQAAGGLLEIHEEHQQAWVKRLKLALVFASLAASIVVFPANTRSWTRREREAATASLAQARPSGVLADALKETRTACLIGIDPAYIGEPLPPLLSRADVLPLASLLSRIIDVNSQDRLQIMAMPAPRWLRLSRTRYQFIYQLGRPIAEGHGVEYAVEWLNVLTDHLAAGGRLMLEIPLEGLSRREILILVGTFRHVTSSTAMWRLSESTVPRLILQSGIVVPSYQTTDGMDWYPLDRMIDEAVSLPVHSIRRVRISGRNVEDSTIVVQWLRGRTKAAN